MNELGTNILQVVWLCQNHARTNMGHFVLRCLAWNGLWIVMGCCDIVTNVVTWWLLVSISDETSMLFDLFNGWTIKGWLMVNTSQLANFTNLI